MAFFKPITFIRFLVFYALGSSPFIFPALGLGYITNFITEWGWPISSALLSGYFFFNLVAEISWAREAIAMDREVLEMSALRSDHLRVAAYLGALIGAILGWVTGEYLDQFALILIPVFYCIPFFLFEKWRVAKFTGVADHRPATPTS